MHARIYAIVVAIYVCFPATAQSTLFDFDNAPVHTSLPIDLSVGGIAAHLSATGQGYSIQPANSLGFTPVGFSGYSVYPNSVFAADLLVGFSRTLTDFSILYAPEEYACDSSARMRVTAYMNSALVGTNTTTAEAGTWPSATLAISAAQGFNRVVVHYDAPPPTGGDWGPIFMADNMNVTPAPVLGDYDSNGIVNAADYSVWRNSFGATINPPGGGADGSNNGVVDAADYVIWRHQAAVIAASASDTGVPEPATLVLVCVGLACFRRRIF